MDFLEHGLTNANRARLRLETRTTTQRIIRSSHLLKRSQKMSQHYTISRSLWKVSYGLRSERGLISPLQCTRQRDVLIDPRLMTGQCLKGMHDTWRRTQKVFQLQVGATPILLPIRRNGSPVLEEKLPWMEHPCCGFVRSKLECLSLPRMPSSRQPLAWDAKLLEMRELLREVAIKVVEPMSMFMENRAAIRPNWDGRQHV